MFIKRKDGLPITKPFRTWGYQNCHNYQIDQEHEITEHCQSLKHQKNKAVLKQHTEEEFLKILEEKLNSSEAIRSLGIST